MAGANRRAMMTVGAALLLPLIYLGIPTGGVRAFMPHGHCYLWQPKLVVLHLLTDVAIALAYLVISATLAYLVYRARDEIPFQWMFLAFGTFIIACGATHAMEVWTMWRPDYWFSGNVKLVTAIASVATALALPPLVPRVLALINAETAAEASRAELEERTRHLEVEQSARREAEAARHDADVARSEAESARAEAEAANRSKDQFLAVVSHELRNPLSPILLWTRLLRENRLDDERRRQAIDAIERGARSQAALVEDLLDVSRIVSGRLRLDVQAADLAEVVAATVETVRPSAEAKHIELRTVIDPGATSVSGDPQRLQQVVWNLLSNAVKFTPRGGQVRVMLARDGSDVELSVVDDGVGIPAPLLPRVFERFWQADASATREQGGLGLGLAIARHIVELHGGTVGVESAGPGQGSVFRVRLPLAAATASPRLDGGGPVEWTFPSAPDMPARLDGIRVLVVDDEPDTTEGVEVFLTSLGAEVRVAVSTLDALAVLDGWVPDVLVSDIGMPEHDGYELIARLRARAPESGGRVPAVALTAFARVQDRVRILAAGFQMHVTKPVDPGELAAVVASMSQRPPMA
jgi:signal transduction histidine kinase/CheY-like chemotaxis protein